MRFIVEWRRHGGQRLVAGSPPPPLASHTPRPPPAPTPRPTFRGCDLSADELRAFLVHVDSITSLVAHRGLDDESKRDLAAISLRCRQLTKTIAENTPPPGGTP